MKKTTYILVLIPFLLFAQKVSAQKTAIATMKVSATIVSGATLENVNSMEFDFSSRKQTEGKFELRTSKNIETHIELSNETVLSNQSGDYFSTTSNGVHTVEGNKHLIEFTADFSELEKKNLKGSYTGNIVTTINYL